MAFALSCDPGDLVCQALTRGMSITAGSDDPQFPVATLTSPSSSPYGTSTSSTLVVPSPTSISPTGSSSPSSLLSSPSLVNASFPSHSSIAFLDLSLYSSSTATSSLSSALPPKIGSLSNGLFIGIVFGGLVVILLLIATILSIRRRRWRADYIRQDETDRSNHGRVLRKVGSEPATSPHAFVDKNSVHQSVNHSVLVTPGAQAQRPFTIPSYNPPRSPPPAYTPGRRATYEV